MLYSPVPHGIVEYSIGKVLYYKVGLWCYTGM